MNDCAFMIGRYPEGTKIPAANNPSKEIIVGGLQICAIHVVNNHQYPCPFTKAGGAKQCKDYRSRYAAQQMSQTKPMQLIYQTTKAISELPPHERAQWLSYFFESLEAELAEEILRATQDILTDRLSSGEW